MTNVPIPVLGPTGFVAPAESAVLAGVQADLNAAFGGNLNPALETPQGQLATSEAAAIAAYNDLFLFYTSQVDPAYASGRMQDAIARIYFLSRKPAEPTAVQCNCVGAVGVFIPTGALAIGNDGNIYICTAGGAIPIGGTVSLPFACTVNGPIVCPAGNLSTIYQTVPGWDTINNPADGVPGTNVESRVDFENRRADSVALNAVGILSAIHAQVTNVNGVIDAYVTENPTAAPVTIGGVSIAANSIYVGVAGGASADIGLAIWTKKPPGCGMVGTTSVTVTDSNSGYNLPYPTYTINFTRLAALPIKFEVDITNTASVPADAVTQVKNAIVAAFVGSDGGPRPTSGSTIYASRFYAPIVALGPWAQQIVSVLIGTSSPTLNDLTVNIDETPTIDPANITVNLV